MSSQEHLRAGDLDQALTDLQDEIRNDPSNPKLRTYLFQLLAVMGQWERALTQLNVVGDMDSSTLMMVQAYRSALEAEPLRTSIFAGNHTPLVFGEPEGWLAELSEALRLDKDGNLDQAQQLRDKALEDAPATAGTINGTAFEWIADGDSRLGPVLEAIVDGKLYWIPFHRIRAVEVTEPVDLRDKIWIPAQFQWANGGQVVGFLPVRYPGSENSDDPAIRLSGKTEWIQATENCYHGLGQKTLTTDTGDFALLDVRKIELESITGSDEDPSGK